MYKVCFVGVCVVDNDNIVVCLYGVFEEGGKIMCFKLFNEYLIDCV